MINLYIRKYPKQGVAIWLCWASRMFSYNPAFYPECDNYTAQISLRYLWLFTGEKRYFRPEKKNSKELIVDFRRRKSSSGPSQSILRMLISGQTQRFLQPLSGGWNAGERPRGLGQEGGDGSPTIIGRRGEERIWLCLSHHRQSGLTIPRCSSSSQMKKSQLKLWKFG